MIMKISVLHLLIISPNIGILSRILLTEILTTHQIKLLGFLRTHSSEIKFERNQFIGKIAFRNIGKIPINDSNSIFTENYSLLNLKISQSFNLGKLIWGF